MTDQRYIGKNHDTKSYEPVIRINSHKILTSVLIDTNDRAVSAGPVEVELNATVTVKGYWSVV
jgi:hypothetical protein